MCTKRDWIVFFAGAEAFHTISHAVLGISGKLPITIFSITLTPNLNLLCIMVNAIITVGLLAWAHRLKKERSA